MQIINFIKNFFRYHPTSSLFAIACILICSISIGYYLMGNLILQILAILLLGGILSIILLYSPFTGLLMMLIAIPAEELVVLPKGRTAIFALGIIVMFFWLIHVLKRGGNIQIAKQPTLLITLLLCWGLMSFFWAEDKSAAVARVISFTNLLLFYILFQDLVKNNKRLKIVLLTYFIAGIVYSLVAIGINLFSHIQRVSLGGESIQNPNHLATSLAIGLLIIPYVFKLSKSYFLKIITVLGFFIFIAAIITTGGRGAWMGLVMALILTSLITKNKVIRPRNLIIIGIFIVISIQILYQTNFISRYTVERITTLADIKATRGGSGRLGIWFVGLQMVKNNPIIGVGLDNFPKKFEDYIEISKNWSGYDYYGYGIYPGRDPHSIFLSIQGELGIIGLTLFFLFLGTIFKSLLNHRRDLRAVIGILLLGLLFFNGVTATIQYKKYFWVAIGIATVISKILQNEKKYEKN